MSEDEEITPAKKIKVCHSVASIDAPIKQQLACIASSVPGASSIFASPSPFTAEMQGLAMQHNMDPLQFLHLLLQTSYQKGELALLLPEIDQKAKQNFGHGIEHIIKNAKYPPYEPTNAMPLTEAVSILAEWLVANGCW